MAKKKINIAIVGATGAVGQTLLQLLAERDFPIDTLYLLASSHSAGKRINFAGKSHQVKELASFDFAATQMALFSAGASVSAEFVPKATQAGCIVIDNTSQFRYEEDVPLIIPEVNPQALAAYKKRNIIANPNCATIQMLLVLKPIHEAVGIERINICTYQAVSGSGRGAISELQTQVRQWLNNATPTCQVYDRPIAFNVLPHIDSFQDNGYTKEEMKLVWETQKILANKQIKINPTAVRVPVIHGHSEAVHIETAKRISVAAVKTLLRAAPEDIDT